MISEVINGVLVFGPDDMTEEEYLAWRAFRDVRIIDIISETDHYVTDSNGRKHKKISDDRSIFDTFEEAKQWLLDKEESDLRKATETISSIKEHIKRIEALDKASKQW